MANIFFSKRTGRGGKVARFASLLARLMVAGLLLAGCEQQQPETAEKQGRVANMVLADLQGVEHSLANYRGKWIIVNYWATWCLPCLEEIPELVQFHNEHKGNDAVVWGVNREEIPFADLKTFAAKQQISYPLFQVSVDSISPLGPVLGIPTTYLVSPQGEVVARHVGLVSAKKLEAFLQSYQNK